MSASSGGIAVADEGLTTALGMNDGAVSCVGLNGRTGTERVGRTTALETIGDGGAAAGRAALLETLS